jgi:hypothetical protein
MKIYVILQKGLAVLLLAVFLSFTIANAVSGWSATRDNLFALVDSKSMDEAEQKMSDLESDVVDNILEREKFIDTYTYLQVLLGKEESGGFDKVKDKHGVLNYTSFYPVDTLPMQEYALRVKRLSDSVSENGSQVFAVNPPSLYLRGKMDYSVGLPFLNNNYLQDAYLYHLQSLGIHYLDLRETLKGHDILPEDYFFRTDHHWKIETIFAAFGDIVEMMDDYYDTNLDSDNFYKDISNYNTVLYPAAYLGSMGRSSGIAFSGIDDFTLIWPKFQTDFVFDYGHVHLEGDFEKALISKSHFSTDDPYGSYGLYGAYLGGNPNVGVITNRLKPEAPSLLIINDSFGTPLATFLALLFSEVTVIWPTADNPIDIEDYLRQHTFDFIMIEQYEGNLNNEKAFSYFKEARQGGEGGL